MMRSLFFFVFLLFGIGRLATGAEKAIVLHARKNQSSLAVRAARTCRAILQVMFAANRAVKKNPLTPTWFFLWKEGVRFEIPSLVQVEEELELDLGSPEFPGFPAFPAFPVLDDSRMREGAIRLLPVGTVVRVVPGAKVSAAIAPPFEGLLLSTTSPLKIGYALEDVEAFNEYGRRQNTAVRPLNPGQSGKGDAQAREETLQGFEEMNQIASFDASSLQGLKVRFAASSGLFTDAMEAFQRHSVLYSGRGYVPEGGAGSRELLRGIELGMAVTIRFRDHHEIAHAILLDGESLEFLVLAKKGQRIVPTKVFLEPAHVDKIVPGLLLLEDNLDFRFPHPMYSAGEEGQRDYEVLGFGPEGLVRYREAGVSEVKTMTAAGFFQKQTMADGRSRWRGSVDRLSLDYQSLLYKGAEIFGRKKDHSYSVLKRAEGWDVAIAWNGGIKAEGHLSSEILLEGADFGALLRFLSDPAKIDRMDAILHLIPEPLRDGAIRCDIGLSLDQNSYSGIELEEALREAGFKIKGKSHSKGAGLHPFGHSLSF